MDTDTNRGDGNSALRANQAMQRMAARLLGANTPRVVIDETDIAFRMLEAASRPGTMIDVGAHVGGSLGPFLLHGWTVHAFEPDAVNRQNLRRIETRFRTALHVDSRAVSDVDGREAPFYRSDESTGISGLSAFRDTHAEVGTVTTVTLASYMAERAVDNVDFLKIDTEGFDLMALRGYPWDRSTPRVIVCEFEDAKTRPLGYGYHDLAGFLVARGYRLIVSEWRPIVRYGVEHRWRRFAEYPRELTEPAAWGNLIAVSDETMYRAGLAHCRDLETRYHLWEASS
jgi:FkbM family methyltransferase